MRRLRCLSLLFACLFALPACKDAKQKPDQPLTWGDAEWPEAPIPLPGGEGEDNGGGDGDTDGGGVTSLGFTPDEDFAGVSECDPFAQDCPEGEKCVAYASTGGNFDANKCVPVSGSGMPGEACSYGGVVEATDDCNDIAYCWDVMETMGVLEGTCSQFCGGTADDPQCPVGYECLIAYEGSVNLCIDNSGGTDTGGTDTGGTDTGGMPDHEDPEIAAPPLEPHEEVEPVCPDTTDPIVLYMSNDDSNSQASPAIVRRLIHDGMTVSIDRVRIHEFLNYYTIVSDNPTDTPAEVGIQMRRTDADTGEFTLLLYASGQLLREDDRPPLNLVFSLDTSGSMSGERISLVKDSMVALAGELRTGDVISLVEWDSTTNVPLLTHSVTGPDDPTLLAAIDGLEASGSTDLHGGLVKAYSIAEASYVEGGINRVILMSDGGANAGETSIELIAEKAAANDGSGIYLVGVGVGPAGTYNDTLMDEVTDAGKGAYVFIDDPAEAEVQFTDRFLSNVAVAARNVQMRVTLPWYFGIKSFHGEEYSSDPAEVEPQHLAPNDAMSFHQIIAACDPESINADDAIEAHVEYLHPLTLEPMSDTLKVGIGALVKQDATQLHKADVVVAYAKALIVIGYYLQQGEQAKAISIAEGMKAWLAEAAETLADPEVEEMAALMGEYWVVLGGN